jgi:hypothetical protein
MNPEDLLSETLRDRVDRTDYPSTPMATVSTRARAIRSRRRGRTTVVAAAAAVAVVAVPGAIWLGHSPGGSPQPTDTTSSAPTSTATADQNPAVLTSLPQGKAPGIDYLAGDTYVTMNGNRITSPDFAEALTATPVRGGILIAKSSPPAVARAHGGLAPLYLVANGTSQSLGCGSDRFAMSTDGVQSAYWVADSCAPGGTGKLYSGVNNTMGESGAGYVATPAGSVYEPIGIVPQGTVVNVTRGDKVRSEIVGASGSVTPVAALAYAGGSDENNDVVSGQIAGDPATGIVVHASTGVPVAYFPGWQLGQFSNDGKYVLGYQPGDGVGTDRTAIFEAATGGMVVELPSSPLAITLGRSVWDFDDTVLATATGDNGSALVRFDLRGNVTRATPMANGSYADSYRLATRP